MFNLQEDGFCIINNGFSLNSFDEIKSLIRQEFKTENRLKSVATDLSKVHGVLPAKAVRFLSMCYGGQFIETEINRLALQISQKIQNVVFDKICIEPGASVVTTYPDKLSNYKVFFHQDDYFHKNSKRYHVLIPINTLGFNLLQVIPKTHIVPTFKHTSIGPLLRINDDRLDYFLKDKVRIKLNIGDVFIFQTSLVHRLVDNESEDTKWLLRFLCH